MSDVRIRQHERDALHGDPHAAAAHNAALLRTGAKVPGVRNKGQVCYHQGDYTEDGYLIVGKKHDWEDRPADLRSVLRLRAYCGDAAAREALGWCCAFARVQPDGMILHDADDPKGTAITDPCPDGDPCGCPSILDWFASLLRLATDLPDVAVRGVVCLRCRGTGRQPEFTTRTPKACGGKCEGTGTLIVETSALRYLAACVGLAVGRVVLPEWERAHVGHGLDTDPGNPSLPRVALNAAEKWTWCPCPDNEGGTSRRETYTTPEAWWRELSFWSTQPKHIPGCLAKAAEAAASVLGVEAVFEAARLMVLEVTGE